ncbi:radical SAM protein [Photorhabdus heterorhabditis]|uniref:radical SAM protein n=1 Tax=Photorhabdus heterorhabditis TaxID=880156 RepID=UPI0015627F29|nr:radical SAM protein [Photorhabdus heterorhabditis]NRN27056.1 4Fe-4S cluster-binding domain-containing protein [Photorhabdus heterorhabditis subsp. aluminescens]
MKSIQFRDGKVFNPEGVEINVALHCNMSCKSCAHLSPLFRKKNADLDIVRRDLEILRHSYHASYVKIMGGEPLLNPNLLELIKVVASSGIADEVLLTTNGTLLHKSPEELWDVIDKLELSLYPSRLPGEKMIESFKSKAAAHKVKLLINYYDNFRFSYSEKRNGDISLVQDVYDTCKMAHFWHSHTVIDGWFFRCPHSVFIPQQDVAGGWNSEVDGLRISNEPQFVESLYKFLTRSQPLKACEYCLGSVGKLHSHRELRKAEWRPQEEYKDLVSRRFLEVCRKDITADDGCVRSSEIYFME